MPFNVTWWKIWQPKIDCQLRPSRVKGQSLCWSPACYFQQDHHQDLWDYFTLCQLPNKSVNPDPFLEMNTYFHQSTTNAWDTTCESCETLQLLFFLFWVQHTQVCRNRSKYIEFRCLESQKHSCLWLHVLHKTPILVQYYMYCSVIVTRFCRYICLKFQLMWQAYFYAIPVKNKSSELVNANIKWHVKHTVSTFRPVTYALSRVFLHAWSTHCMHISVSLWHILKMLTS